MDTRLPTGWMYYENYIGASARYPFPIPVLEFDPSKMPMPEWATYIPDRNPAWKIHGSMGHAKNAMRGRKSGIVYQWQWQPGMIPNTGWVERCRQDGPLPERCQECDAILIRESGRHKYHTGITIWDPREELKRLTVCRNCGDKIRK